MFDVRQIGWVRSAQPISAIGPAHEETHEPPREACCEEARPQEASGEEAGGKEEVTRLSTLLLTEPAGPRTMSGRPI
jgi:hypothetical protein